MSRHRTPDAQCTCPLRPAPETVTYGEGEAAATYVQHLNRCGGACCRELLQEASHHFGCTLWGAALSDPYIPGVTKTTRQLLGSPRVPYATWAAKVSLYAWPLWRNWTPPVPLAVESVSAIVARQSGGKPADYAWRLWSDRSRARAWRKVAA